MRCVSGSLGLVELLNLDSELPGLGKVGWVGAAEARVDLGHLRQARDRMSGLSMNVMSELASE